MSEHAPTGRAIPMPTSDSILLIVRVAAWATLMRVVGVMLTETHYVGSTSLDSPLFLGYVFLCLVAAWYLTYDNWQKSHTIWFFVGVVVLGSVTGSALGELLGKRVLEDVKNSPQGAVVAAGPSVNPSASGGSDPGHKPQSDGVPGEPGASLAASPTPKPGLGTSADRADLSLASKATPDPVTIGSTLTLHLTVTNRGPATASTVQLRDTLPQDLSSITATPSQGTCSSRNHVVTCALGKIAPGRNVSIRIIAKAHRAATVRTTANVTSTEEDPNQADNTVDTTTVISPLNPVRRVVPRAAVAHLR